MSGLIGHGDVVSRFREALAAGALHHAWLLYGIRGIGKMRLAEHLAGLLVCESRSACGDCHGCKMLAAGSHPDVFRISLLDGKRDLNIEQVRELLAFLALSGAEGGHRVVILDDAERMNNQAANALLKGLEEPAAGNVLLMVCDALERLPATIRSRCMLQQCTPLSETDVRTVLSRLDPPIRPVSLDLAAELAEGSPGAVCCMQNAAVAEALQGWQALVSDIAAADIGKLEAWIQRHVKNAPHPLLAQMLARSVSPLLEQACAPDAFEQRESLQQALAACLRWPGDVLRHSLRPGPALLACVLQLRAALKAAGQ